MDNIEFASDNDFMDFWGTFDENWHVSVQDEVNFPIFGNQICDPLVDIISDGGSSSDCPRKSNENIDSKQPFSNHSCKQNRIYPAIRKHHTKKVIWSQNNSKNGKTHHAYIKRQLRIARRMCKQLIISHNNHEVHSFCEFMTNNCLENLVFREITHGVHPITGIIDSDVEIVGLADILAFTKSFFTGVPDSTVIVDRIEVLNEGKLVEMKYLKKGTAVKPVDYPESNGSNEVSPDFQPVDTKNLVRYTLSGKVSFTLDQMTNKLCRIDVEYYPQ